MPLCTPVVIYLVLAALSVISLLGTPDDGGKLGRILGSVLVMGLFAGLLHLLCINGYMTAAWILLLLPIVFLVVTMVMLIAGLSTAAIMYRQ